MYDKSDSSLEYSSNMREDSKHRHSSRHDKEKDVLSDSSSSHSRSHSRNNERYRDNNEHREEGNNEQPQTDELKTVKVREIWVGNLPIGISESTLYKNFFIYGEITKIDIHSEKCFAFIRYKLCASASKAYEKAKNMNLGGRIIRVSFSDSGKRREIIGDEPGYELSEKTCKLIHVSLNKSSTVANESVIKDVFSKFGNVKCIQTKSCLGYRPSIYVEFSKCEEAEKAIQELNNQNNFDNRKLLGDPYCEVNYYYKKKKYPENAMPFGGMNNMDTNNMNMNNPQNKMNPMMMNGMYNMPTMMNPMCKYITINI